MWWHFSLSASEPTPSDVDSMLHNCPLDIYYMDARGEGARAGVAGASCQRYAFYQGGLAYHDDVNVMVWPNLICSIPPRQKHVSRRYNM
jgi:hypothetical protein